MYSFKCVILGDENSGKTSIVDKLTKKTFNENVDPTVGVEYHVKTYNNCKLRLWTVSGNYRFRNIIKVYYSNTKAFVLVYDVTCRKSFESIDLWLKDIPKNCILFLVGNKSENKDRIIEEEEGKKKAEENFMIFMETSAKSGENINLTFEMLYNEIRKFIIEPEVKEEVKVSIKSRLCRLFW